MPNWVYNGLTIEGNPEQINKLVDQMNKPFVNKVEAHGDLSFNVKEIKYSNPVFAFFNIHSYKDEGITDEEYAQQPKRDGVDMTQPDWFAKSVEFAKTQKDWY